MFTAEEARKLAKEVKDKKELLAKREEENKKQKAIEEAEPIINKILEDIKQAINEDKDYIKVDLSKYDKETEKVIVSKFNDLGFNINYVTLHINSPKTSVVNINWGKDEKMKNVNMSKDNDYEKAFSDLFESLKKDKQYFEHKPIYWFHEEFPRHFFL